MICKNCGKEHPKDMEANPHYCIARMDEKIEELTDLLKQLAEKDAEIERLTDLLKSSEEEMLFWRRESRRLREQYNSLIFEVSYKFPGESRHDTAKRYIREREEYGIGIVAKQAMKEASHEST